MNQSSLIAHPDPCSALPVLQANDRGARLIVWGVWLVMFAAALGFIGYFGSNVPFWDEWNLVDQIAGAQPVTLQWLWAPHNGHRIPVPKLALMALAKVSGGDFRAGMYFNVITLAAASAGLILASERLRGKAAIADIFFPLLLLHWGHYENLLWSWQVTQILPVVIVCGLLSLLAVFGSTPSRSSLIIVGLSAVILPLCGIPGLAYAPALICWLLVAGLVVHRQGRNGQVAFTCVTALLSVLLIGLYFYNYTSNTRFSLFSQPRSELKTGLEFAAGGLGPISWRYWPATGAATLLALICTGAGLALAAWRENTPAHRPRSMLLFFAGVLCLVITFATGRTGMNFVDRYFAMAAPLWCVVFLSAEMVLKRSLAWYVQLLLALILLVATPLNLSVGLRYARVYHQRMEAFRTELLGGASAEELVAHHVADLCACAWSGFADAGVRQLWGDLPRNSGFPVANCVSFHEWIVACLRHLAAAEVGDFSRMRQERRPVRQLSPSAAGLKVTRTLNDDGDLANAAVLLTPDHPTYLSGVLIRRPAGSAPVPREDVWGHGDFKNRWVQLFWRLPGQTGYMAPNRYVFLWDPGKDEQIVWIYQPVTQLAFHVGDRSVQRSFEANNLPLTILLPADKNRRVASQSRQANVPNSFEQTVIASPTISVKRFADCVSRARP